MDLTQEVLETIQKKGLAMKRKYEAGEWQFLGGQFTVYVGIYGTFEIQVNSGGKVMRIKTSEGAYLKPSSRGWNGC